MELISFSASDNDSHTLLRSSWIDKLAIFQTAMDHEQSIRTNYQMLLTTLEIAILSFFLTLVQLEITNYLWVFIILGIFLCFPFGIASEYRARNVDIWRILIVYLIKETDVEKAFQHGKYQWVPYGKAGFWGGYLFGHWFERILITLMLLTWAYISWYFSQIPMIIQGLGLLALFGWIFYAFRLIEPKGKIIVPDLSEFRD